MNYLKITQPDINNGLGFRVTLWVAGCSHHCPGCHNQWTWNYNQGKPLEDAKEEIYKALSLDHISGLTISGGDPLSQSDDDLKELFRFICDIKRSFPDKDIWIYAGDTMEEIQDNVIKMGIIQLCDYYVDGTFHKDEKDLSLAFRGSRNQRIWKKENGIFNVVSLD